MHQIFTRSILLFFIFFQSASVYSQLTTDPSPYCVGTSRDGTFGGVIGIDNVLFHQLAGPPGIGPKFTLNSYVNANDSFGTAVIVPGMMHHLSIREGNGGTNPRNVRAWIDYNGNNFFDDASEIVTDQNWFAANGNVISSYFNVPAGAVPGNSKLRVRVVFDQLGTGCGNIATFAQTFDFNVQILAPMGPRPVVFDGGDIVLDNAGFAYITNVTMGTLNVSSSFFGTSNGITTSAFNYSNQMGMATTSLTSGVPQNLSVSHTAFGNTVGAWIDWNNDGDFLDANEQIGIISNASTIKNLTVTPPAGIPHNTNVVMRVRVVEGNVAGILTPTNVFSNSLQTNETEDFRVLLLNPSCTIAAGSISVNNSNLNCNGTVDLTLNGSQSGATIQWLQSNDNINFTPILGATNLTITSPPLAIGNTFFKADVTDGCTVSTASVTVNNSGVFLHASNSNQAFTTCGGTYRDAGNTGNYPLNFGGVGGTTTTTFFPCTPGQKIELNFSFLNVDNFGTCGSAHFVRIYDGNSTAAPLIGCFFGNTNPGIITSTALDGSLTIQFGTDNFAGAFAGWEANISCTLPPALVCAAVSNLNASLGTPLNGLEHHLDVSWNVLTGATSYDIEVSTNGSLWTFLANTTATSFDYNAGDNPNAPRFFRVRATDGVQVCPWATMSTPIHTAADAPALPNVVNPSGTTLDLTLVNETPVNNPTSTTYSIFEQNTGLFVQANGTLGATEVFQTKAAWGTSTVNNLSPNTSYCFVAKARNNDGHVVGGSGAALTAVQPFDASGSLSTQSGSGPTTVFWSPSSCTTGGLTWNATNGCPGGAVGFQGSFNNFFGCFLRAPAINATGLNEIEITFDVTHTFSAATATNRMRIYFWADGAFNSSSITSLEINGVNKLASFGVNGQGILYDEARNCAEVKVVFDISGIADKSSILFYLEPNSLFNNSFVFSTWIDNVSISEPSPVACATTLQIAASDIAINSVSSNISALCGTGNVDYTLTLINNGSQDITAATPFDISVFDAAGCTGNIIASQSFSGNITANGGTINTVITVPLSGSGNISFLVDAGNVIVEQDETNNCLNNASVTVSNGLSGTYTINAALPAGGNNFISFTAAAAALNTQGVCGPVIFDVTGTFTQNIVLNNITGASATNTITFQSADGNPANAVIQANGSLYVVDLNGAKYITFDKITIRYFGTSLSVSAFRFRLNADNNTISNSVLMGNLNTGTSTAFAAAVIFGSETSVANDVDQVTIINNHIIGGAHGIYFDMSTSAANNYLIENNRIENYGRGRGIFLTDIRAAVINANTISIQQVGGPSAMGISINGNNGSRQTITNNYIFTTGTGQMGTGIHLNAPATAGNNSLLFNNAIQIQNAGSIAAGIDQTSTGKFWDIIHNTVYISGGTNASTFAYRSFTATDQTVIKNNVFANFAASTSTGTSTNQTVHIANPTGFSAIGNNVYFTANIGTPFRGRFSATYTSFAAYTAATGETGSLNTNPEMVFTTNVGWKATASNLSGAAEFFASITSDIDGNPRSNPSTIGAHEQSSCLAGIWNGNVDKLWFNPDNWDCGVIPNASTPVVIPGGRPNYPNFYHDGTANVFGNPEAGSIEIQNSGSITLTNGVTLNVSGTIQIANGATLQLSIDTASTIDLAGNWENNGVFVHGNGTVIFSGNNTASVKSNLQDFYHVIVNKSDPAARVNVGTENLQATLISVAGGELVVASGIEVATEKGEVLNNAKLNIQPNAIFKVDL